MKYRSLESEKMKAVYEGVVYIILLYHGTIDKYADHIMQHGVLLSKSKSHLDFGPGFYTTPDKKFAIKTAGLRAKKYNMFHKGHYVHPRIVVITCDEEKMKGLKFKKFQSADDAWARFILANRCSLESVHKEYDNNVSQSYDIVSGPTADGTGLLTSTVAEIDSGKVSIEDADYNTFIPRNTTNWGNQISFHTKEAISCIQLKTVL